jgi:nitrite reductase/ring-hydroxylating ferredoxin subunit
MPNQPITQPYGGYFHGTVPEPDLEMTQVGPDTPGGEYLRRFWHPIGLTSELNDLPKPVRILGEDLVLFRDGRGEIGLLELHCAHRGTSLEFGMVERCGIRCCYHGWLYDVDGKILETPGEPVDSRMKDVIFHGAYPTHELNGMIFAYMGPPQLKPAFPMYDSFSLPGYRMVPGGQTTEPYIYDCNWLQLAENNGDVVHFVFLHYPEDNRTKLNQFRPSANPDATMEQFFGEGQDMWEESLRKIVADYRLRALEWQESPVGVMSIHTRRVGEFVWVRLGDYMMPNVDQYAPTSTVPDHEIDFGPPFMTAWTVPVDDTHTMSFQFRYVPDVVQQNPRASQLRTSESVDRSYFDRQREPGDYEAQESQREIAVHEREHLGFSDGGVVLVRKLLREGIRAVQRGEDPTRVFAKSGESIPTYCRNWIQRIPPAATPEEDRALITRIAREQVAALLARVPHAISV